MTKKCSIFLLIIIILAASFNFVYWSEQKSGFHCDETYTFGLANKDFKYSVYDDSGDIKWNTPSDIKKYLTVSDNNRFDYANVYYNQKADVHPPLFYFVVHTLSSFIPEEFSIYTVIIPNVIFMMGIGILLYFISYELSKNNALAFFSVFLFLFSANSINMVTFLRMYCMVAFFATWTVYLHIKLSNNNFILTKKNAVAIFISVILGVYTHYYFLIYIFIMSALVSIYLLCKQEKQKFFSYIKVLISAGILYLFMWPPIVKHLLTSYRGKEAVRNAMIPSLENMINYISHMVSQTGYILICMFLLSVIICIIFLIKKRNNLKLYLEKYIINIIIIATIIAYTAIIIKIAPYQSDRYIFPVLPLFYVSAIWIFNKACILISGKINFPRKGISVTLCAVITIGLAINVNQVLYDNSGSYHNYLYRIPDSLHQIWNTSKSKKCVMIYKNDYEFMSNITEYCNYEETAFVNVDELEKLKNEKKLITDNDFVLYVYNTCKPETTAERLTDILGFSSFELLSNTIKNRSAAVIYRIYK